MVQSRAALVGGTLLLAAHLFVFCVLFFDWNRNNQTLTALLAAPLAVSTLTDLAAAFSRNAAFRVAAITAACVSSLVPAFPLIFAYGLGMFYFPGIVILLVAVTTNAVVTRHALRLLVALATGLIAGVMFLLSYWPLALAYDSCDHLDRHPNWRCVPGISDSDVAIGFGIIGAAMLLLWLTAVFVGQHPSTAAEAA